MVNKSLESNMKVFLYILEMVKFKDGNGFHFAQFNQNYSDSQCLVSKDL